MDDDYRVVNRANWDERAMTGSRCHAARKLAADPAFLSQVVRFDLPRLGSVQGQRGVHLQCHTGTDTISLARLGATMTGLDFSSPALDQGRDLASQVGSDVEFVEADVYDAVAVLGAHQFDLVYTGIGALCWLPSIRRWASVIAGLLRPGGRLFLREGHPLLWAVDDRRTDQPLTVDLPYFELSEPVIWADGGRYVAAGAPLKHNVTREWNHGLGEIVTALLDEGMTITALTEHDSVPWKALPGLMERTGQGEWRLADRPWRLPHSYTLQAVSAA